MQQNTAEKRDVFTSLESGSLYDDAALQPENGSYAQTLRTLGHALESHHFLSFEINVEGDTYVVKGITPPTDQAKSSLLRSLHDLFTKRGASERKTPHEIELRYSAKEIFNLGERVRRQRSLAPEMPDPHSLSQLLRGIGCYLDKKFIQQLITLAIKERRVLIGYRGRDGQLLKAEQDIEYFYNFWIKMYMHRSSRPPEPPPSQPTVCVAR